MRTACVAPVLAAVLADMLLKKDVVKKLSDKLSKDRGGHSDDNRYLQQGMGITPACSKTQTPLTSGTTMKMKVEDKIIGKFPKTGL